jgi:hypothetical protein
MKRRLLFNLGTAHWSLLASEFAKNLLRIQLVFLAIKGSEYLIEISADIF